MERASHNFDETPHHASSRRYQICLLGLWLLLLPFLGISAFTVHAQDAATCPENTRLAFSRTVAACGGMNPDTACYGDGNVAIESRAGSFPFDQPGDRALLDDLRLIRTISDESTFSAAVLKLHGSFNRAEGRVTTVWMFGDALMANNSPRAPELEVTTLGSALLRGTPTDDGIIISRVSINTALTANGRTVSGGWVRVFAPGLDSMAWVKSQMLSGGLMLLEPVENPSAGYAQPFLLNFLSTGRADAPCEGAPQSGVVIQTAGGRTRFPFVINNTIIVVAGTVFIQAKAGDALVLDVIDGSAAITSDVARFSDLSTFLNVPAGARVRVAVDQVGLASVQPLASEPYNEEELIGLPLDYLPVPILDLLSPLPPEQIATQSMATLSPENQATLVPLPTVDTTCRREMRADDDLRAGPGDFYEISTRLLSGALVVPVVQTVDPDGVVWWQLISGAWVRQTSVRERGICQSIPVVESSPPPATNEVSMESCEPANGPIRANQQVTFRFTPPAFPSLGDAMSAPTVDPGRIIVDGAENLAVSVTEPQRLTANAISRTFFGTWTAMPGVHRVISERLSYSLVCDFTVPPG